MLRFRQPVPPLLQKTLVLLVEKVSFFWFPLTFAVSVALFAAAYTYLTPLGHGVGQNFSPATNITYFQGIYFSIITISSLGYGDMYPIGISRALVCFEVLIGITLIGIMIARVTSQRLSYHVSRLFSSNVQKRLDDFIVAFETTQTDLKNIMPKLAAAYPVTPTSNQQTYPAPLSSEFQDAIAVLSQTCVTTHEYFATETVIDNVFQSVPPTPVVTLANAIDEVLMTLVQLIISLSPHAKAEILIGQERQRIFRAINAQRRLCALADECATDNETLETFKRVKDACEQVSASYGAAPGESQPNQVVRGMNDPQQTPGTDTEPAGPL